MTTKSSKAHHKNYSRSRANERTTAMAANLFERLAPPPPTTEEAQKPLKPLPAQQLLNWLIQRWDKDIVWMKDIRQFGPYALRNPKTAIDAAGALIKDGWLIPEPTRRYDAHKWRFVRKPVVHPLVMNE